MYGRLTIDVQEGTYDGLIGGDDPNARVSLSCPDGSSGSDSWPWVAPLVMNDEAWPQITPDGRLDGEYFGARFFDGTRWKWHFDPAPPSTSELP